MRFNQLGLLLLLILVIVLERLDLLVQSGRLPWEENKVDFDHFVDRKRWRMFYGRCYFLTMALMVRLYDEAHFYKELAKELQAQGVRAPEQKGADHAWHSPSAHEERMQELCGSADD